METGAAGADSTLHRARRSSHIAQHEAGPGDRRGGAGGGGGPSPGSPAAAAEAHRHPLPGRRRQQRRLLPLQVRDGGRHQAPGGGPAASAGRQGGGRVGAGPGAVLGPRGQRLQPPVHRGRERVPPAGSPPARPAARARRDPALHRVQPGAPRGGRVAKVHPVRGGAPVGANSPNLGKILRRDFLK